MPIHILTPFSRPHNLDLLVQHLRPMGVIWHPIFHVKTTFPGEPWIQPLAASPPSNWDPCYWKLNAWIERVLSPEATDLRASKAALFGSSSLRTQDSSLLLDWYGVLCDDDLFGAGVIPALQSTNDADNVAVVSAKRGHFIVPTGLHHPTSPLLAVPQNMRVNRVSNGQMFLRGRVLKAIRYQNASDADGQLCEQVAAMHPVRYFPRANTFLNVLQPGRWDRAAVAGLVAAGRLNVDPCARLPRCAALTLVRDTPDLVDAMRRQIPEIRIVDNGSIEPIRHSWLRIEVNRYWSGGWNAALAHLARTEPEIEWAWLLNSDVSGVNAGQLDALIHFAQRHGAVMVSPGVRRCSWPMMRVRGIHDVHHIDCVCPVVHLPWFAATGGFDERLPGWGADVELCYRTRNDKKLVVGSIVVNHPYRTTSNRLNDHTMYRIGDTRRYMEAKHGPAIREFLPGYWRYREEE